MSALLPFPLLATLPRKTASLLHGPQWQVPEVCPPVPRRGRDVEKPRLQRFPPQSVATICLQHARHRGGRTRPFVTSACHASELQPNICILVQYACSNLFLRCAWQAPLLTRGERDAFLRTPPWARSAPYARRSQDTMMTQTLYACHDTQSITLLPLYEVRTWCCVRAGCCRK
jgi:hypothetical protein